MKQQSWLMFLKYPYSTAVITCVWIGSAIMIFINRALPIISIIIVDIVFSWIISYLSLHSNSIK
jgi:hypothetical protein